MLVVVSEFCCTKWKKPIGPCVLFCPTTLSGARLAPLLLTAARWAFGSFLQLHWREQTQTNALDAPSYRCVTVIDVTCNFSLSLSLLSFFFGYIKEPHRGKERKTSVRARWLARRGAGQARANGHSGPVLYAVALGSDPSLTRPPLQRQKGDTHSPVYTYSSSPLSLFFFLRRHWREKK